MLAVSLLTKSSVFIQQVCSWIREIKKIKNCVLLLAVLSGKNHIIKLIHNIIILDNYSGAMTTFFSRFNYLNDFASMVNTKCYTTCNPEGFLFPIALWVVSIKPEKRYISADLLSFPIYLQLSNTAANIHFSETSMCYQCVCVPD